MKATSKYNLSKIFRNAWYMFKAKMFKTFAAALRKAWRSEKLAMLAAKIEAATSPRKMRRPKRRLITPSC